MKIIKIFQLRCDEEVKERLRWFTGEVLGIERLMTLDQITVPEEGGLDVQIREFIESLGVRCVSPEEWNRLDRRRNVCVVRRLFEYTDDDRAAAEWLWVASTSEISLDGERRVGADGVTCVTNASIARTSRCVGLFLDRFAVRDDLRSEIDSASPPLRGFCFREVRIESWAARGQLRAAFWEPIPEATLPPMPPGSVERRTVRGEPLPPTARFGLLNTPGMDDARLVYPRASLASIGGVDLVHGWEQRHDGVWPLLLISNRFYREVFLRNRIDVSCVPVHIIEPGPEAGLASLE